ncbi:hypothetical protein TNCT_25021 [Trichonephila clavata]|uniref:Uncharacterized protein n=1 Tax=Trichonephila clavata TaxID=2740835 RepID=A0A8X6LP73_TRICU|nr:hypothetical protein TNCT_25021 [Trichonephila clavata]
MLLLFFPTTITTNGVRASIRILPIKALARSQEYSEYAQPPPKAMISLTTEGSNHEPLNWKWAETPSILFLSFRAALEGAI